MPKFGMLIRRERQPWEQDLTVKSWERRTVGNATTNGSAVAAFAERFPKLDPFQNHPGLTMVKPPSPDDNYVFGCV